MDKLAFHGMFRDLLLKLHDYAALENHPLTDAIEVPPGSNLSRGEFLRRSILAEIARMEPGEPPLPLNSPEYRAYLILHHRYAEGMPVQELATRLAISDRQLRRDHSRALQGLASRVWERYYQGQSSALGRQATADGQRRTAPDFVSHIESLNLAEVLRSVAATIQPWATAEGLELTLQIPDQPVNAVADRVVVRQILISLFGLLLHNQSGRVITLGLQRAAGRGALYLEMEADPEGGLLEDQGDRELIATVQHWINRQHGQMEQYRRVEGEMEIAGYRVWLPRSMMDIILVVDDQPATVRVFQRFASHLPFQVIGLQDAARVVDEARRIQPRLITLDVMMPFIDGWELLQALKLDKATRQIPIVVCSAWEEPELARALGAQGYLKKPVTRKDFIAMLNELGLIPTAPS